MLHEDMEWQRGIDDFLHIGDCWECLGVTNSAGFKTWREKYPVTVAVLDSGIMKEHAAFRHLLDAGIQGKNFTGTAEGIDDNLKDKWHGTRCASIIAGGIYRAVEYKDEKKKEFPFWNGVAPFVNLYICKTNTSDDAFLSDIKAIRHLIEEKKNGLQVDVISMSSGLDTYNAELQKYIQEASLNNIIVVCAANNDGRRSPNSIEYPARFGDVICVGSHDNYGHASSFTSVGREIDILGPGEIRSATLGKGGEENAISAARGTSYATPYVAGMVAIILANAQRIGGQKLRSSISNNVVMKQVLREMASEPGDHSQSRGHGTLDPLRIFDFQDRDNHFRRILESITTPSPEVYETPSTDTQYFWNLPQLTGDRFTFEVQANSDVHVALSSQSQDLDNMYEIVIGGWSNTQSVIRRSKQGSNLETISTHGINSQGEYRKFWITWSQDGTIAVGRGGKTESFMQWTDPNPLPITYAGYSTGSGITGLWKFCHNEDEKDKLETYDLRKVAIKFVPEDLRHAPEILQGKREVKHTTRPVELLAEDVKFSSTMDLIALSLPDWADVLKLQNANFKQDYTRTLGMFQCMEEKRSVNLKVFSDKIKQEVAEISCLVLPSPSDAAYGDTPSDAADGDTPSGAADGDTPSGAADGDTPSGAADGDTPSDAAYGDTPSDAADGDTPSDAASRDTLTGTAALQEFLKQLQVERDILSSVKNLCLEGGDEKLSFSDIKEILQTLQGPRSADSGQLTVHCENVDLLNIPEDSKSLVEIPNVDVLIHLRDKDWKRAKNLVPTDIPKFVTIEECYDHCSLVSKHAASFGQGSKEDKACDCLSLEHPACQDGAAPLHATMQKYQNDLKTGVHITIAVLGSGVYIDHKDLKSLIKAKACFVPQESWDLSMDTLGTGTALTSIVANTLLKCYSPAQTQLLVAKVIDEHGKSNPAWVADAVNWAANDSSPPADIILIPVGFEKFDHKMYKAVTEAQKNGKIVIAAAAHNRMVREISYPARHGDVICVGSHSRTSTTSSFGVRGREMDFLMMGEEHPVKAASAEGTNLYRSVSGTSVAAAMATAVVGFTLMYAESVGGQSLRDKLKSNTMIRELLREECSSHTPDRGYGTLDPDKLFKWEPQHFRELVKKFAKT